MKQSSFWNKGGFVLPAILILAGFFIFETQAYDPHNAHRALTYEMGEFYNFTVGDRISNTGTIGVPTSGTGTEKLQEVGTPNSVVIPAQAGIQYSKLSEEEMDWMMQGAEEEDTPPRWINHFYNPKTGEGWKAEKLGGVDSNVLAWFSKFALSSRAPISSKNWAKNRLAQGDYWRYGGDQTWQRAIELYASGDKKSGLIALGHTLHLLEDLTVPNHTRNDTHVEGVAGDKGSALEKYAQEQTTGKVKDLKIAENLKSSGRQPLDFPILENYFEANAKYSYDNFFSDDTIKNYDIPRLSKVVFYKVNNEGFVKGFVKIKDDEFPVMIGSGIKELNDKPKYYSISDPTIMSAYWDRLSKQAVISGAGAINLFFKEVEEYKKLHPTPSLTLPLSTGGGKQFAGAFSFLRGGVISPFGELVRLNKKIVQTITGAQNFITKILPQGGKTTVVETDEFGFPRAAEKENAGDLASETAREPENYRSPDFGDQRQGTIGSRDSGGTTGSPAAAQEVGSQNNPSQPPLILRGGAKTPPTDAADTSRDTATDGRVYVSRVIDGDTVTLSNGKDARLIGIDSPESGDECFEEAKQKLSELALGQYVRLEKDQSETDKYGRLLRFIYIGSEMINSRMLADGYAKIMSIPPDTKFVQAFKVAEGEAKFFKRGCLYGGVGGGPEEEIHNPSPLRSPSSAGQAQPPVILRRGENHGPYYGGSSYASNAGQSGQNQNTVGSLTPYSNAAQETASSSTSLTLPLNTGGGNNVVTSTPETATSTSSGSPSTSSGNNTTSTPSGSSTTSTPESAATSTPSGASATSTPEIPPNPSFPKGEGTVSTLIKIFINEIQLAGETADDEFIELYNPNTTSTDITDWKLTKKIKSGTESNLISKFAASSTIPGRSYFLIRPQFQNGATSISADANYTGASYYISNDNAVILKNQNGQIIDKVGMGGAADYETQAASNPPANQSVNRQNFADTDNNANDFIIASSTPRGTSSTPVVSPSTSSGTNTAATSTPASSSLPSPPTPVVCETPAYDNHKNYEGAADRSKTKDFPYPIVKNQTVTLIKNTTYYVDDVDGAYVPPGARLRIEEGVVIKFGRWRRVGACACNMPVRLRMAGSLEVNGTKNNPVIFTTFRDDAHGAAINFSGANPAPGDWGSLSIESGAAETIQITGAKFYYAGGSVGDGNNASGAIFINMSAAQIDISDTEIRESESGIYFKPKPGAAAIQPNISGTIFKYNRTWGITAAENFAMKIIGNIFQCNGLARNSGTTGGVNIVGDPSSVIIESNDFLGNQNTGLYYYNDKKDAPALSAKNNYWNSASGPTHETNSSGTGDKIIGNVDFLPFAAKKQ